MVLTRRALLKANINKSQQIIRLPWVSDEIVFVDVCTRCHNCLSACPEKIIVKGDGGFPEIDFRFGECTFCTDCVKVCPENLFTPIEQNPWPLKAKISEKCLSYKNVVCNICKEQCETEAISFTPRVGRVSQPELVTEKCTGCGACIKPCPTQAITVSYQYNQNDLLKENAS